MVHARLSFAAAPTRSGRAAAECSIGRPCLHTPLDESSQIIQDWDCARAGFNAAEELELITWS